KKPFPRGPLLREAALAMMFARGTPSMADKRENSVLFSLRELRQIEDDRVKSEEQAIRQREEDERARVVAEQRRIREEEEQRRLEIERAERARIDAEEARRHEAAVRLEEGERKARVEAQARLEEQRLKLEIEARAREASTRKAKILVASTAIAVVIAITGVFAYRALKEREAAAAAAEKQRKINEEIQTRINDLQTRMDSELAASRHIDDENKALLADLNKAKNAEEVKRINEQIERNNAEKARRQAEMERLRVERAKLPVKAANCQNSNDPFCGMSN